MAQVKIYSSTKQTFFGKVAKLDGRASRLGLEPVTVRPLDETGVDYSPCGRYAESWQTYYVEGPVVKLNGYQLVGVLKSVGDASGNTVTYRNENHDLHLFTGRTNVCDHCGVRRERNSTFIVCSEKTGKYYQLGSTCVLSFVGSDLQTDPEAIARFFDGLNDLLLDDEDRFSDGELDDEGFTRRRFQGYPTIRVVAAALKVVEADGRYISIGDADASLYSRHLLQATSRQTADVYGTDEADFDKFETAAQELIDFCIENGHEVGAGWAADVVTCLKSDVTKQDHFGLVVSSVRLKEIIEERREAARKLDGVPEEQQVHLDAPERKRIKGIDLWFLGSSHIETDYGSKYINRFRAQNGAQVVWLFSGEDFSDTYSKGDKLNVDAYVKALDIHPTYGHQTLINRVKVND